MSTSFSADKLPKSKASEKMKIYERLALSICGQFATSNNLSASTKQTILNYIKKYEGHKGEPTEDEVIAFLNKNKQSMKCIDGSSSMNYVHYAFKKGKHNNFVEYVLLGHFYSENEPYDFFNAVSKFLNPESGRVEPMTVLDYLEKVLIPYSGYSSGAIREITEIKDIFLLGVDKDDPEWQPHWIASRFEEFNRDQVNQYLKEESHDLLRSGYNNFISELKLKEYKRLLEELLSGIHKFDMASDELQNLFEEGSKIFNDRPICRIDNEDIKTFLQNRGYIKSVNKSQIPKQFYLRWTICDYRKYRVSLSNENAYIEGMNWPESKPTLSKEEYIKFINKIFEKYKKQLRHSLKGYRLFIPGVDF